jgi:ABC-type Fe3+/spermidine/putrescine transport system ATPase subunit
LVVIYVTHRLEDAFVLGHRLAVLAQGRVQQAGLIDEVFSRPADGRVAQIMGLSNLFQARVLTVTPERLLGVVQGTQLSSGGAATRRGEPELIREKVRLTLTTLSHTVKMHTSA